MLLNVKCWNLIFLTSFWSLCSEINSLFKVIQICDTLRDLVPFVQFKKRENTHGGVLPLKKLQTPPCVFLVFIKLHKWYQITQSVSFVSKKKTGFNQFLPTVPFWSPWKIRKASDFSRKIKKEHRAEIVWCWSRQYCPK